MKKDKTPDDNQDDENPGQVIIIGGPPANLPDIIANLFAPAVNPETADLILSAADLFDTVNQNCDASKTDIYNEMITQNFRSISSGGELYWLVMEI